MIYWFVCAAGFIPALLIFTAFFKRSNQNGAPKESAIAVMSHPTKLNNDASFLIFFKIEPQ